MAVGVTRSKEALPPIPSFATTELFVIVTLLKVTIVELSALKYLAVKVYDKGSA